MIWRFIKEQRFFIFPYLLFVVTGITFFFIEDKVHTHLILTEKYSDIADIIFYWLTKVAEGWFGVPLLLVLLCYQYRAFLFTGLTYLISAIITQLLKNFVFEEHLRPLHFLRNHPLFRRIPDVEILLHNSFPSGHSTSAFALFFCLALLNKNNYIKVAMFVCALTVAYSRIYLNQHFLQDIVAGSIIGVGTGIICHLIIYEKKIIFASHKFEKGLLRGSKL